MPTFFFNAYDGTDFRDDAGLNLADLAEARIEAVRLAGALLIDKPDRSWTEKDWRVEVSDKNHLVLFVVMVSVTCSPATKGLI